MKIPSFVILSGLFCSIINAAVINTLDHVTNPTSKRDLLWRCLMFCLSSDSEEYDPPYYEEALDLAPMVLGSFYENMDPGLAAELALRKMKWIKGELRQLKTTLGDRTAMAKLSERDRRIRISDSMIVWNICASQFQEVFAVFSGSLRQNADSKKMKKLELFQDDLLEDFTHVKAYIFDYPRQYGFQDLNPCELCHG